MIVVTVITVATFVGVPHSNAASINPTQDTDGDGIPDVQEDKNGNGVVDPGETDPMNADSDRGGESDGSEIKAGRNPFDPTDDFTYDADGDGWPNWQEMMNGTDPKKTDSDADGVIDSKDPFPLDPKYAKDTNANGLPDEWEQTTGLSAQSSVPTANADPDNDGLTNAEELAKSTNPLNNDSDGDGMTDAMEIRRGTDPLKTDSDGDGVIDSNDAFPLDSKYAVDLNGNSLPDEWEKTTGLTAQSSGTPSASADLDRDGITNAEEFAKGTNPVNPDSDHDGIDDATELEIGSNPKENACLSMSGSFLPFSDLQNHWANEAVSRLQQVSILPGGNRLVVGYRQSDSSAIFRPDQPVTRFEFLKMALLSTCTELTNKTDLVRPQFPDVRSSPIINEHPGSIQRRQVIYTAVLGNIVQGYTDGTFQPDSPVNRAEAVKMLTLAARITETPESSTGATVTFRDVPESAWFAPLIKTAAEQGIVHGYTDGTFRPGNPITRAEAAAIIERTMLQNPSINGYVLLGK